VLEWECCIKDSEQARRKAHPFIEAHIIQVATAPSTTFAAADRPGRQRKLLGLS